MIQKVDLGDNRNLFTVSVILIAGVGGMVLNIGKVVITSVACSLILGILTNLLVNIGNKKTASADGAQTQTVADLSDGEESANGEAPTTEAAATALMESAENDNATRKTDTEEKTE